MAVERAPGGTSLIDVLDRVLDKGIVIDAWVRISLVGIDLITIEARVVVALEKSVEALAQELHGFGSDESLLDDEEPVPLKGLDLLVRPVLGHSFLRVTVM